MFLVYTKHITKQFPVVRPFFSLCITNSSRVSEHFYASFALRTFHFEFFPLSIVHSPEIKW